MEEAMTLIDAHSLSKTYGSAETAVHALRHIELAIPAGAFFAVMGPSGCGKSTLLQLLGGLDRPSAGEISIEGQILNRLNDDELTILRRQRIGFVFQAYNLIPVLSALENVALPLLLDGVAYPQAIQRAQQWLAKVGLGERSHHRPRELSGGQQQRVAIARALVSEPALILADEPTGNLDTQAADTIIQLLRQAVDVWGRSVLMVTHDPRIAAYADRIIFLKDGTIVNETILKAATEPGLQELDAIVR
jgi:putative ABC transport system ATP-binding protein